MKIELLWFEDCPNHEAAYELLQTVLTEFGVTSRINRVEAADPAIAERIRFPGSPTIRINGKDIDPSYQDSGEYTPRCRIYLTESGLSGVPDRSWIENALNTATEATLSHR